MLDLTKVTPETPYLIFYTGSRTLISAEHRQLLERLVFECVDRVDPLFQEAVSTLQHFGIGRDPWRDTPPIASSSFTSNRSNSTRESGFHTHSREEEDWDITDTSFEDSSLYSTANQSLAISRNSSSTVSANRSSQPEQSGLTT